MELGIIEDALPQSNNIIESDIENKPFRGVRAIILVILLNCFFVAGITLFYLYLNTVNEVTKKRILDYIIVSGALIAIPMLYRLGDLSKGGPNFYYI
ncbi:uncharacterized protein LOC108046309 [Drosophila rhopaloa]|uniref:Uncharacterized protein n=1 Tax=Drosophila rhopaloa TaxID=1041015 RepID=A0ABM5J801_DRORH|nr:uncharacterized protein LOC108046309 [Drosophila rhopaloa]